MGREAKTRKVPYKFCRTMEDRGKPSTIDLTYLRSNECRDTCWRVRTRASSSIFTVAGDQCTR